MSMPMSPYHFRRALHTLLVTRSHAHTHLSHAFVKSRLHTLLGTWSCSEVRGRCRMCSYAHGLFRFRPVRVGFAVSL